jgi:hypothetical protein
MRTRRPSRWSRSAMSDAYTARPTRTRLLRLLSFVLTTKARFREMHSFSGPIGPAGQWTPAKEMAGVRDCRSAACDYAGRRRLSAIRLSSQLTALSPLKHGRGTGSFGLQPSYSAMQAPTAKQANEKIPIPCEHCHGTGIIRGIECRECLGRGHRVVVAGRVVPLARQQRQYTGRRTPPPRQR